MTSIKRILLTIICFFTCILIISTPEMVTSSVRRGIKLNLSSVIPALLPFMVLTNFMLKYNLCRYVSYLFHPVLSKIFAVSPLGSFALMIGFTCGFPMGAKTIGDLFQRNQLSKSEALYLITFCNNCSISFLLNYIVLNCLHSEISSGAAISLIYIPPLLCGIINRFFIKVEPHTDSNTSILQNNINPILNAVKSISVLSVYIICFTVISEWITSLTLLPDLLKSIFAGMTEITSGTYYLSNIAKDSTFLILACTVFGGLSIMFQSFEQLPETSLKLGYIVGKIEQLIIFCLLYFLFRF